ncbi:pre-mRNA-splicing factor CWC25 homolog isoform X1 [Pseudoliparis swirei]|uniref:pre-mRNA-splicing factor CWC25 homolog isoform X1 n=1 Tax=Pseudoliparis swirei TaxID=2059687 RepID=UPI0024BED8FF|nr:pre-mRNA-splicing factor CWC25 homolog isoform X1 [Pseudoliparis swirei]
MGGGDLNLKKSWHPQTMKNIERVWKAEQKHEAECKKIEELQKELKDERAREEITKFAQQAGSMKKKDDRLDWMYQGPAGQVSRDEYLMGRSIDKQITDQFEEQESGPSAETGLLPGSIFNPTTPASNLDLAAKIREDPLFEIRKREEEKKREVLSNPVKMKKIKEMLRQNLNMIDKKKKRKKGKKEKKGDKERRKEKKHKRRSSSSGSVEEDEKKHRSRSRDEFSAGAKHRSHHHHPGYGLQVSEAVFHYTHYLFVFLIFLWTRSPHDVRLPSKFPAGRRHQPSGRSRSPSPHGNNHDSSSSHRGDRKVEPSSQQAERYQRQRAPVSRKLSPEELERKRREMMDHAKQRDEDRENNVKRYKRQEEQEKLQELNVKYDRHAGFIHHMKLDSAASSSVEDRVRRNIHSIQRTPASLDNFMKR